MRTFRHLVIAVATCLCLFVWEVTAQQRVFPTIADINAGNVTFNLLSAHPYTKAFLLFRPETGLFNGHNCTSPPSYANGMHVRTTVETVRPPHAVRFDIHRLEPGTYHVCLQNTTMGNPWSGTYYAMYDTVTIVKSRVCSGGKFGICKIDPAVVSNGRANQTFTIYYAAPGTKGFLLLKNDGLITYNCSNPPPLWTNKRTRAYTIGPTGKVTFQVKDLYPGHYTMCFFNYTHDLNPPGATYEMLSTSIVISGDINPTKSSLSCCDGPFQVGSKTYCTITTVDTSNNPAGTEDDACRFRICPMTDGQGANIKDYVLPYFVKTGIYEFWIRGTGAGCSASAGASYDGKLIGNKVNYFQLNPGPADPVRATSSCWYIPESLTSKCNVTQRDTFGNPVRHCTIGTSDKLYCSNV